MDFKYNILETGSVGSEQILWDGAKAMIVCPFVYIFLKQ